MRSATIDDLSARAAPAKARAAARPADRRRLDRAIIQTPTVGSTLLSKIGMPGLSQLGFGIVFPMVFLALAVGLIRGRMQLVPRRLLLFLVMVAVLGMVQVVRGETFSLSSLALMVALGCWFLPSMTDGEIDCEKAIALFCNVSALIALLGVVQFGLQFVAGHAAAFPLDTWLPDSIRVKNFNDVIPLRYGSSTYKSNGMVMIEPSFFSQLTALGLIAELTSTNRRARLLLYFAALVVAYSGTGLLVLALSLPVVVIMRKRWDLLIEGALFIAIAAIFADQLHLDLFTRRIGEFGTAGSSADARFVSWMVLFADRLWNSPIHALFGYGIGSFVSGSVGYNTAEMAHTKIIFEFGVIGATFYFGFILYCIFSSRAPLPLRIALMTAYFMNGAYSPWIIGLICSVLLWPRQDRVATEQDKPAARRTLAPQFAGSRP